MFHRFHFVLSLKLKADLVKISKKFGKKLSKSIAYMIKLLNPVIDNFLFFNEKDLSSGYSYFNAEEEIFINISENDYNILRIIQSNKKIFSKAVILRKIIEFFIVKYDKFGLKGLISILGRYKKIKLNRIKLFKIYRNINNKTHMCIKSILKNKFCFIYNKEFELTSFQFLDFL